MTEKEAIEALRKMRKGYAKENEDLFADDILCEFLDALGYGNVVLEYHAIVERYT